MPLSLASEEASEAASSCSNGVSIAVRNTHLRDFNVRSSLNVQICRDVLWGMVERLAQKRSSKTRLHQREVQQKHRYFDDSDDIEISTVIMGNVINSKDQDSPVVLDEDESDSYDIDNQKDELASLSLPLSFKSSRSFQTGRKKKCTYRDIENERSEHNSPPRAFNSSRDLPRSALTREDNLFLAPYSDGMLYPVRVYGNGPSSSLDGPQFVAIQYLGYGPSIHEVARNSLVAIPPCNLEEVQLLADENLSDLQNAPQYFKDSPSLMKYWDQRHRLFSKYDEGILLDEESWYSVTPEVISNHITKNILRAIKISSETTIELESPSKMRPFVIDLFCGCGGNSISMAAAGMSLLSVDIDPVKVSNCKHNAGVYGVSKNIELVVSDVYDILKMRTSGKECEGTGSSCYSPGSIVKCISPSKHVEDCSTSSKEASACDFILMSPPWGGPDYSSVAEYYLRTMVPSGDGVELIVKAAKLCHNIVYIIPYNTKLDDIAEAGRLSGLELTVEDIYLYKRIKVRVVYFGPKFKAIFTSKRSRSELKDNNEGKKKKRKT